MATNPLHPRSVDDLARPHLPLPGRAINRLSDAQAARLFPLREADLLDAAKRRTGLTDFGDDDFLEPLRLLLADVTGAEPLSPLGRLTARQIIAQLLDARLCVEDRIRDHPQILALPVPRPVLIVGLPRTGTTYLHNLLSRIPALRYLPLWESVNPLRPPRRRWWPDMRRMANAGRVRFIDYMLPLLRLMHEMDVDLPHEELQLSAIAFRSFFFEASFRLPSYQPWYAARDNTDAYLYLRRCLQVLQHERGGERWVLKSPQHLEQLDALRAAFPDARIVRTHRDPVQVVTSLVTMLTYVRRVCYREVDPVRDGREWTDRLEQMLRASVAQHARIPVDQVLDVRYHELVSNPQRTFERVLEFAGVATDHRTRRTLSEYIASHARDGHGRIRYDLAQLGLNPDALRERFRFYTDLFDLPRLSDAS